MALLWGGFVGLLVVEQNKTLTDNYTATVTD